MKEILYQNTFIKVQQFWFIQPNFKLVKLSDPAKLVLFEVKQFGLVRAIETAFLTFLIFIQFEANFAQSNFEYNFYNAYKQKF